MDTDRLRYLANQIRKKDDTDRSMRLARLRQERMLPNEPDVEGFEFAAEYKPAAGVSGDFYDFIEVGAGKWGIVVGDVSGHGVEAGIIMGMAKQTVSIFGRQMERPLEVLSAANAELYRSLGGKTFVSMSYAVLEVESRTLRFVRAGQCRPLRLNPRWKIPAPQIVHSKGLALGVDSGPRFTRVTEEIELKLEPGDIFFQFTDGLVEATNRDKEQFGERRLMDVLQRYGRTSPRELIEIIRESLGDFTRDQEEEDDITMLAIKVRDPQVLTRTARFDLGQVKAATEKRALAPPVGLTPPAPKLGGALAGVPAKAPSGAAPPAKAPPGLQPQASPAETPAPKPSSPGAPAQPDSPPESTASLADMLFGEAPLPESSAPPAEQPPAEPKVEKSGATPESEGKSKQKRKEEPNEPDEPRKLKLPPLPDFPA